jgi:transposase
MRNQRKRRRRAYSTDVSDAEWMLLEPLVPPLLAGGRPGKYPRREILNAVLYALRNGCAWRNLPHDLPPWRSVYNYYWTWRRDGTWERLHDRLRGDLRQALGRQRQLSAGIIDSQSVKTTEKGDPNAVGTRPRKSAGASGISSSTRSA